MHISALDEFARLSELEKRVPQKTSEWLTARELTQYFPYAPVKISEKLVALAKEMPGKIEKRQSGPQTPLCLHISALDEFARLSELEKRAPQKTSEWLTAQELTQYFPYAPEKISEKLVALAKEMPGKIEKRQSGPHTPLCLHISALDEFARLSELEKRAPQKTSEWLTAKELTQYFPYTSVKISEKLVALAKEMPGKIEKRQSGIHTVLCLHRDALDEFARLSELEKRIPQKTSEWLTAKELTQYFPYRDNLISEKLVALAKEMPGKIEERQSGTRTSLCLHRDALDEFARLSKLEKRVPQKTSEWLTAKELTQYLPYTPEKISEKLVALAKEMPGKIEKRQYRNHISLCLHIDALDEFARLLELEKRVSQKTSEWLTAKELTQYFPYAPEKISEKLVALAKEMPGKIEERQSGSNTPLCLHISALDEFARLSELEKRAPQKTSEWLTAKELTQYFLGGNSKILRELEKLVAAKTMPGKIEKRQSGPHTPLCLHISALDEFARLSGLKRRGEVTPEKFRAGTKVVKAMTQMAESKKQTKGTIAPDNQYE